MTEIDFIVYGNNYITKCPFSQKKVGSKSCYGCKYFVREKSYIDIDGGGEGIIVCSNSIEMIQIKIRKLIVFIIVIALFSSLLINCSQHSLIKALEHSIEQRDSLLNESLKFKY